MKLNPEEINLITARGMRKILGEFFLHGNVVNEGNVGNIDLKNIHFRCTD